MLTTLMAGRAANALWTGGPDTGASADLEVATKLAMGAVCNAGLGDTLLVMDDAVASMDRGVQAQVSAMLDDAYRSACDMLRLHEKAFLRLTRALAEKPVPRRRRGPAEVESRIVKLSRKYCRPIDDHDGLEDAA